MSIYYDPVSKEPLRITSIENMLTNRHKYGTKINLGKFPQRFIRRIGFRSNGCTCQELACGCCLGINLQRLNFSREGNIITRISKSKFLLNLVWFVNLFIYFRLYEFHLRPK